MNLKLLICFTFLMLRLNAQSISGGELYPNYIGNNKFLVNLILYVNCFDANPGNATIKAKCKTTGTIISSQTIAPISIVDVSNVCASQCTRCSKPICSNIGIKSYTYQATLDLSSSGNCCEIIFYYAQGKRSSLITTGPASSNFYIESYLNRCLNGDENILPMITPEFLGVKGVSVSQAMTLFNDSILTDSLSYEFTKPMKPDLNPVSYTGQYSYDKPCYFWGFPNKTLTQPRGIQLTADYGQLTFRPMNTEVALFAIKIKQYVGGQIYKEFTREFMMQFTNQSANTAPQLLLPQLPEICTWSGTETTIKANDIDGDSVFFVHSNPIIDYNNSQPSKPEQTIKLLPQTNITSKNTIPYIIRIRDNKCPVPGSTTLVFPVKLIVGAFADINVADSGCGTFQLSLSNIKGEHDSVFWFIDNQYSSGNQTFVKNFYEAFNTYNINILIKNKNGCKYQKAGSLTTGDKVKTVVDAGKDDTVCYNGNNKPLFGVPNDKNGVWSGTGVYKENDTNYFSPSQLNVIKNKSYSLIYTYLNADGCKNTDTINMFVLETTKPEAGIFAPVCENSDKIELKGIPSNGKWYGKGVISNFFNPDIGYGKYKLIYEITTNGLCPNFDTSEINVSPLPNVNFIANPPNGYFPLDVTFQDSSTIINGTLEEYLWNFGDGQTSNKKGNVNHIYEQAGDYSVILITKSSMGCIGLKIVANAVGVWKSDIQEKIDLKSTCYPNPFSDYLIIQSKNNTPINIKIINSLGQLMYQKLNLLHENVIINTENWSKGAYHIIQYSTENFKSNYTILK